MTGAVGAELDFYRQVLGLRGYRQQILSADIANASTPGFKAVDLSFKEALAASLAGQGTGPSAPAPSLLLVSDPRHIASAPRGASQPDGVAQAVKYQIGSAVTLDGNSVDLQMEKVQAAQNAVDYEAAVTFTAQTISMLMTAIKGSPSSRGNGG